MPAREFSLNRQVLFLIANNGLFITLSLVCLSCYYKSYYLDVVLSHCIVETVCELLSSVFYSMISHVCIVAVNNM